MKGTERIDGDRIPSWIREETFTVVHNDNIKNSKTDSRNGFLRERLTKNECNGGCGNDMHDSEQVNGIADDNGKFIVTPNPPSRPRASTIGSDYRREILQRTNKRYRSIKKDTQIPVLKRNSWRSRSTSHATKQGHEINRADEMSSDSSKSRRHSIHHVDLDTDDDEDINIDDDDDDNDETFLDGKSHGVLRIKRKHLRRRIVSDPYESDTLKDSAPVSIRDQTPCETFYNKTAEKVIERYRKRANSDVTEQSVAMQHFKDIQTLDHDPKKADVIYLKHNVPRKLSPLFPERPETKPGYHQDVSHVENNSLDSSSDDILPINTHNKNYSADNELKANLEADIALRTNIPGNKSRKALTPLKDYTPNILSKTEREISPFIMEHGLNRKGSGVAAAEPLRRVNSEKARPISRHGNLNRDRPASVKDKKHPRSREQLKNCSAEEMEKLKMGKGSSRQGSRKSLDRANSLPDSEAGTDERHLSEMMSQLKTCRYLRTNTDLTEET